MKRTIIFTLVMVLFASVVFAGDIRGSKWGCNPLTVRDNENMQGGELIMRGFNDEGLYELQFEVPMKMGKSTTYYVFDDNKKLIYTGIVISMKESNWNLYYDNYQAVKGFLTKFLKGNTSFNKCEEIQVIGGGKNVTCQDVMPLISNHVVFEEVELYNEILSNKTIATMRLFGNGRLGATITVHYTPGV